jgi:hypothetical protein
MESYRQGKMKNSKKNLSQCHCAHYKSHMELPGREITIALKISDRLCGLVVSVEDYKQRGPGFDSRFFCGSWVWNGVHSAS